MNNIQWEWCDQCDVPMITCPEGCKGTTCNASSCDWCEKEIHPVVNKMWEDGTIPSKEMVERGAWLTLE